MRTILCALTIAGCISSASADGFDVIALGARGGIEDGNLSAFLIRPADDDNAVTCDAGSLVNGIRIADEAGVFDDIAVPSDSPDSRIGHVLNETVKGYLISHAHLDHVAGLLMASPDDSKKPIYALRSVNERIERNYFNWEAWPNFGDRGKEPRLSKYAYTDLAPGRKTPLADTKMDVTAFPLSHSGVESTAFLIEAGPDAILCFGDTGPDEIEKTGTMAVVWGAVVEKVRAGKLRAVIIEVSYANAQPDKALFGHLTPAWLLKSLRKLDAMAGGNALKGLPVIISHIKYSLKKGDPPQVQILTELEAENDVGARFIVPEQGAMWTF